MKQRTSEERETSDDVHFPVFEMVALDFETYMTDSYVNLENRSTVI